ncbi:l-a virus gag n-acetyltransferase [Pyrenophora seminiperda CCB06]|uniref:N-terminal methionine N(alpha)-acetyltransferase NatC n=1 Tax=Pyrenophora seminiperda CCB06 TaxID=1302712 RepID=A0A3M7MC81_9PLEO|nr:l-a virus gag n-acetyltransferase [Pyrenophora seminiperda CCB06]
MASPSTAPPLQSSAVVVTAEQPPASEPSPKYIQYEASKEEQYLPAIRQLISKDLSEPYSIYVYRYFLYQWGDLCYMALSQPTSALIGVITCKLEPHRSGTYRGYIAMLATQESYRGRGIATQLVRLAIEAMTARDADEIVLETEVSNTASLKLYERLGFIRSKRLHRYYLNGNAAFRLVLYLKEGTALKRPERMGGEGEGGLLGGDARGVGATDAYAYAAREGDGLGEVGMYS